MLQKFLDYLRYELNRAPLTVEAYGTDISQFQNWLISQNDNQEWTEVSASKVRSWLASLARSGESPRTLRRKIISLRAFFKWMMKSGFIKTSPLVDVPLPKIPKPLPDLVKPAEIEQAISSLGSEIEDEESMLHFLVVETLYSLGIRRAELIALNDSDISFSKGEIKVTGKRSKQRVIPVPQKLLDHIQAWQNLRDRSQQSSFTDSPLFTIKGKRIAAAQVYQIVKTALAGSSARKKSPHALRHSFASSMLNGGAEIDSVREFLGHQSLATTQIYTHISLKEIKKAYSIAHPRAAEHEK